MLNQIISACQYLLSYYPEAEECRSYIDNRISKESQSFFQFGYYPEGDKIKTLISIVGEDILRESKLLFSKEIGDAHSVRKVFPSYFENYPLVVPFRDTYGGVIALVARTLLSEDERKAKGIAKYKNTVFKKGNYLFGLYENKKEILERNMVFVVEGQFDVIKSYQYGLRNVVALSCSNMSYEQFALIKRYTDNIILLLDNDEAGEKGRKNIIERFGEFANIQNFYLPKEVKDIDQFLQEKTYEELKYIIEGDMIDI